MSRVLCSQAAPMFLPKVFADEVGAISPAIVDLEAVTQVIRRIRARLTQEKAVAVGHAVVQFDWLVFQVIKIPEHIFVPLMGV